MSLDAEAIKQLAAVIQSTAVDSVNVSATAFKAPAFWPTNAQAWFVRLEASFDTHAPPITNDKTKFQHVVQLLDSATSRRVMSILRDPPATGKYQAIKDALLAAFEPTQLQKDTALLKMTGLGDRKPSELLQFMSSMNTDPTTLFRALFISQLPDHAQRAVAREPASTSLATLADIADRVVEVDAPSIPVAAVQFVPQQAPQFAAEQDSDEGEVHVNALNQGVGGARAKSHKQGQRQPPQQASGGSSQQNQQGKFALCKYHVKFGAEAQRCTGRVDGKPCALAGKAGNDKARAK